MKKSTILAALLVGTALPAFAHDNGIDANGGVVGGISGTGAAGSSSASTHGNGLAIGGNTVDVVSTGKTTLNQKGNKQTISQTSETAGQTTTGGLSLGHGQTSNSTVYSGGTVQFGLGGQVKAHSGH